MVSKTRFFKFELKTDSVMTGHVYGFSAGHI